MCCFSKMNIADRQLSEGSTFFFACRRRHTRCALVTEFRRVLFRSGSIKLITLWFPPQRVGRLIGLTVFLGTLGASIGGAPLAFLVRSEERRVGKECVSTCRSRWSP